MNATLEAPIKNVSVLSFATGQRGELAIGPETTAEEFLAESVSRIGLETGNGQRYSGITLDRQVIAPTHESVYERVEQNDEVLIAPDFQSA